MKFTAMLACAALALGAPASYGAYNLQVTEIWMGNDPGTNLTQDWFEVTNVGAMAWNSGVDGQLYFDDSAANPVNSDLMAGVTSIAPGESVIFVDDSATVGGANVTQFLSVWGAAAAGIQIGTYQGAGMSQTGDGATLFVSNGQPLADFSNVLDADPEIYPTAVLAGGGSWDVINQRFSTVGDSAGSVASVASNDVGQFAIASLGSTGPAVPEPSALLLGALALVAVGSSRRN